MSLDPIAEIKGKLDIVDVVGAYVQLKKAGRNYKGLCPFHGEKSPSFVVSTEKQICHCFGCGKGGDIFSFIQEIEGATFSEALKLLADRAGIKLDDKNLNIGNKGTKDERDEYFRAHELATSFYEKNLWETDSGKKVLEYLYRRGMTDEMIKFWRLGFAPDSFDVLSPMLLKEGISKGCLLKSGLSSTKNIGEGDIFDKFRLRLMFPIFNSRGQVCGFGGRSLKSDQQPKYLNSAESIIYDKSSILYGFDKAKEGIKKGDAVVLVEGYFDALIPFQFGFDNVVATCGTALTDKQANLIKRLTDNVYCCFDGDSSGFEATRRAYEVFVNHGIIIKIVNLGSQVKDPAEKLVEEGKEAFAASISEAEDFLGFYLKKLLLQYDFKKAFDLKKMLDLILPMYVKLSPVLQDYYLRDLALKINVGVDVLRSEMALLKVKGVNVKQKSVIRADVKAPRFREEEILLALLVSNPGLMEVAKNYDLEFALSDQVKSIYKTLLDNYNSARLPGDFNEFIAAFDEEVRKHFLVLGVYIEEKYHGFNDIDLQIEVKNLIEKIVSKSKNEMLLEMKKAIGEAEASGDREKLLELLAQYQNLLLK